MMHTALYKKLGSLPMETRVWVGHEYTVKNLEYAATVEPDNEGIKRKLQWARSRVERRPSWICAPRFARSLRRP